MSALLLSCDNASSIESDAKRLAELQKRALNLVGKASKGDVSVLTESAKISAEASALTKELEEKYKNNPEDAKKFSEAYLKEMSN